MSSIRRTGPRRGRLAALVAAGALTLTGCDFSVYDMPLPGGADLGDDPYAVTVEFRDVLDLVPQSTVKVDDVTVGRVDEISADGYQARVTVLIRDGVELPANAVAEIRQTSLLGEKFVSLEVPETGATGVLEDGDVIPLERSGRNPEVEEVLGAMSLLLNGGGVAQLKTISVELNNALEGRESDVKSVLTQLDTFMGQLDDNKSDIVAAIESLNRLAIAVNKQRGEIELALDELPQALASIDRQRDDLVRMLDALNELSDVGVEVIRQSKAGTIESLRQLDPILTKLGEAGDSLPKALQVFLTYPFVDEVVGRNPAQARNLHMGDYTNLSVQLDLDLRNGLPELPGLPGVPGLPELPELPEVPELPELPDPGEVLTDVQKCAQSGKPNSKACQDLTKKQTKKLCKQFPRNPVCSALGGGGGGGGGGGLPGVPDLPGVGTGSSDRDCSLPLVCRPAPGGSSAAGEGGPTGSTMEKWGYNSTLGALLIQGMVEQ